MFDKFIDEFISSDEMKEYLKMPHRSVDTIAEIIYYSPAPIERKKLALMELLENLNQEDDWELIENSKVYLSAIQEALELIDADGVFSIEQCSYNEKDGDSDCWFDGLFNKFDDLVQYIKYELESCEVTDDEPLLYQVVKWINDVSGKLVEACTYWIVRGEVWFTQVEGRMLDDDSIEIGALEDLNLPVPFKAGDIVEINFYPFADKRIIEIIEVGDNHDCCCLQALSRRKDGNWTIGAVKHCHIGDYLILGISPLYTMATYKNELPPEYEVLTKVNEFIGGKEENGSLLRNVMDQKQDITDEVLLEFMEHNKKKGD
ncbi:MAG: hypothetical protein KBS96_02815 [Lachnospiraceae bacterium]|nr:hypothetical protein [Candidatus Colinaster scatohippi]